MKDTFCCHCTFVTGNPARWKRKWLMKYETLNYFYFLKINKILHHFFFCHLFFFLSGTLADRRESLINSDTRKKVNERSTRNTNVPQCVTLEKQTQIEMPREHRFRETRQVKHHTKSVKQKHESDTPVNHTGGVNHRRS